MYVILFAHLVATALKDVNEAIIVFLLFYMWLLRAVTQIAAAKTTWITMTFPLFFNHLALYGNWKTLWHQPREESPSFSMIIATWQISCLSFFAWVSQEVPKIDKNYSQVESQVYRSHFYVIPEGNKRGGTYPEHNFSKRFWTFFWIRFHLSSNSSRPLCTQIVISSCRYVTLYLGAAHERYFPQAIQTLSY